MGKSKLIIKESIAITCCLLLVIGAGRAMAKDEEGRNDERHVYVEEHDSTARANIEVRETVRADAGMGRQDIQGIEADDREEVPESEPEDTEAESASDGSGGDSTEAEAGDNDIEVDYAESANDTVSDMESTDSTGWDGWMENDPAVSEYSECDSEWDGGDSEYSDSGIYEEPESGVDSESESYDDSNEQYGGTEYSEDTDNEYSDGYAESGEFESAMPEPEIQDTEYVAEPTGEMTYLGQFVSTAYCACPICTGSYSTGYTASGTLATEGRTVACNSLPFGTQIYIEGYGYYIVEDTGWSPYEPWLDIFYSTHEAASAHGLQYVNVYLVN